MKRISKEQSMINTLYDAGLMDDETHIFRNNPDILNKVGRDGRSSFERCVISNVEADARREFTKTNGHVLLDKEDYDNANRKACRIKMPLIIHLRSTGKTYVTPPYSIYRKWLMERHSYSVKLQAVYFKEATKYGLLPAPKQHKQLKE